MRVEMLTGRQWRLKFLQRNFITMFWTSLHLLRLTGEGRSDLHNERSCADDHSESIVHPWSSSTCCIQVFLGRPGGRFQSEVGHLPCERLTQCWRMLWAGTSGGRRQTCPSNECLLSAMMRGRSVSFIWFWTESLVTKSYHFMFRVFWTAEQICQKSESVITIDTGVVDSNDYALVLDPSTQAVLV